MNIAIILAGGTGSRLNGNLPKQYLMVNDKPILAFSLETFQKHKDIDKIIIVANEKWQDFIKEILVKYEINKFVSFAKAGESRQHSVLNGINQARKIDGVNDQTVILVQDAARPNTSSQMITEAIKLDGYDAALPVVPIADTVYYSDSGREITKLLDRDKLYAGQTPEAFLLNKLYAIHENMTDEELCSIRGACQLAHNKGLKVRLYKGEHSNYKITTMVDLEKFRSEKENN